MPRRAVSGTWASANDDADDAVSEEAEWEAGAKAGVYPDDYDLLREFEAARIAERLPLTPEQWELVEKERRMLLTIEIPEGWV
jgi:hypothetical protein